MGGSAAQSNRKAAPQPMRKDADKWTALIIDWLSSSPTMQAMSLPKTYFSSHLIKIFYICLYKPVTLNIHLNKYSQHTQTW